MGFFISVTAVFSLDDLFYLYGLDISVFLLRGLVPKEDPNEVIGLLCASVTKTRVPWCCLKGSLQVTQPAQKRHPFPAASAHPSACR